MANLFDSDMQPTTGQSKSGQSEHAFSSARLFTNMAKSCADGFARADQYLADGRIWMACAVAVLGLQLALIAGHRPWLDEWQALLIAVKSPDMSALFTNLRYEGHPALWYLILRTVAALVGNPFVVLPLVAAFCGVTTQAAILFLAPFRRLDRLMLALSQFVLFEFNTLSRSLTLGAMCAILAVAFWRRPRCSWLFVALLPQCDFLFGVISLVLVALRWRERRIVWPMAGLWLVSGLVAAWTVRPMPDIVPALLRKGPLLDTAIWMSNLSTLALPLQMYGMTPTWNNPPPLGLAGFALVGLVMTVWLDLRGDRFSMSLLGGFTLLTLVFSVAVYPLAIRHLMLCALVFVLLRWRLSIETGVQFGTWSRVWLALAMACGLTSAAIAAVEPFDRATEAAALIRRMNLTDRPWVAYPRSTGEGIAAINGMIFGRLMMNCGDDFVRWNYRGDDGFKTPAQFLHAVARRSGEIGRFYVVSPLALPEAPGLLHRLAVIPPGYDGQPFALYVAGPDRPVRSGTMARCSGAARPLRPL